MRQRPGKDDEYQQQATRIDRPRDRSPAEERGRRTEQTTNDDILGRRPLQPHRVDDAVAEPGREVQPRGERVYKLEQHECACNPRHPCKGNAARQGNPPGRDRAVLGTCHHRIDTRIRQMIHGGRRARDERDAHKRDQQGAERR